MHTYRIGGNGNAAYDLTRFESGISHANKRKPTLVLARPGAAARAKAKTRRMLQTVAILMVAAAVVIAMLYSRAMLTELNQKLDAGYSQLDKAKSESTRLATELEAKVSLRNVEEYATQRLGMSPVDKSQVTYIELSAGDKIELTDQSPKKTWIDEIRIAISNVQEYINSD